MPEELQGLLDKIREEGIEKAQTEAEAIRQTAREEADRFRRDAEKDAEASIATAEERAAALEERSRVALKQAARDVILSVADALQSTLRAIVNREISAALTTEALQQILASVIESYVKGQAHDVDVLVNPSQQQAVADFFLKTFGEDMRKGIEIKGQGTILSGFKITAKGDDIEHDFSQAAIADALCELLRDDLGKIVREAGALA